MRLSYNTAQECFGNACAELKGILACDESAFIDSHVTFFVEDGRLYTILKFDSVMIRMAWEGAWTTEWIC